MSKTLKVICSHNPNLSAEFFISLYGQEKLCLDTTSMENIIELDDNTIHKLVQFIVENYDINLDTIKLLYDKGNI